MTSKSPPESTYTITSLHPNVVHAVSEYFVPTLVDEQDESQTKNNEYWTYILGKFVCINGKCHKGVWTSGHIALQIRGYPGNGYNAVVYNQRCKNCKQLGKLTMDNPSYIERVAYRLKKWAGIQMETPYYGEKETPPHKRELCEACRRGYCEEGMRQQYGHRDQQYGRRSFYH